MIVPTTKIVKGDAYMICNTSDVDQWVSQGWSVPKAVAPAAEPETPVEPVPAPPRKKK
jgi:hypothetical protein